MDDTQSVGSSTEVMILSFTTLSNSPFAFRCIVIWHLQDAGITRSATYQRWILYFPKILSIPSKQSGNSQDHWWLDQLWICSAWSKGYWRWGCSCRACRLLGRARSYYLYSRVDHHHLEFLAGWKMTYGWTWDVCHIPACLNAVLACTWTTRLPYCRATDDTIAVDFHAIIGCEVSVAWLKASESSNRVNTVLVDYFE